MVQHIEHTQDAPPDPNHYRRGVCLAPLTCAPNAFNSGNGLMVLDSRKSYRGEWSLSVRA